ncbi:hypothetical protein GW932_00290 [archaeon]|nr:hypothetical protein [archaeon]
MNLIKIDASEMISYLENNLPKIDKIKETINYFKDLQGNYLEINNKLIPFPNLPFVNYKRAKIDNSESTITPSMNFENGYRCGVSKKGLIGKIYQNMEAEDKRIEIFLSTKIR